MVLVRATSFRNPNQHCSFLVISRTSKICRVFGNSWGAALASFNDNRTVVKSHWLTTGRSRNEGMAATRTVQGQWSGWGVWGTVLAGRFASGGVHA